MPMQLMPDLWEPKTIDNEKPLTLLDAIEQILYLSEDSALCAEFYEAAKRPVAYLSERMQLTSQQAVLFATIVGEYNSDTSIDNISMWLGCSSINLLRLTGDLDILEQRRLIRRTDNRRKNIYVPAQVLDALRNNEVYVSPSVSALSCDMLFVMLGISGCDSGALQYRAAEQTGIA